MQLWARATVMLALKFLLFIPVLQFKLSVWFMLGKYSTAEIHLQSSLNLYPDPENQGLPPCYQIRKRWTQDI